MKSHVIHAVDANALTLRIAALKQSGFQATLGIVFCSIQQDIKAICQLFTNEAIDLIGCTTAGEIANDQLLNHSLVAMLLDLSRDFYTLKMEKNEAQAAQKNSEIRQAGIKIRHFADEIFQNPALIVVAAGIFNDGEQIVEGLKNGQREIPIFGGLAGDDLNIKETIIFDKNGICHNGLLALILDNDRIAIQGLATSGWEPLGAPMKITKVKENIIYEINQRPALDFFIDFFGAYEQITPERISTLSAQYPFQVKRNGNWVLRSPISANEQDRSLVMLGALYEGDEFRFSISPGPELVEQVVDEFGGFKDNQEVEADALILFSCTGRKAALGPFLEDEIAGIYQHWNCPMIGFLTYGEIGNISNGNCEFHNETCSLVALKEK